MSDTKFFFEEDTAKVEEPAAEKDDQAEQLWSHLRDAGVTKQASEPAALDASKKWVKTQLVEIEYGPYQGNYGVNVVPVHPRKNLASEAQVKRAMQALVITLNSYVGPQLNVNLAFPQNDWKMKVLSAVVIEGNQSVFFKQAEFEEKGVHELVKEIEKICME